MAVWWNSLDTDVRGLLLCFAIFSFTLGFYAVMKALND